MNVFEPLKWQEHVVPMQKKIKKIKKIKLNKIKTSIKKLKKM